MDRERIREDVARKGGQVLDINWAPFGTGWAGSKNERIYAVRMRGGDGRITDATCKTSFWSGVYWTDFGHYAGPAGGSGRIDCPNCGVMTSANHAFCPNCGRNLREG